MNAVIEANRALQPTEGEGRVELNRRYAIQALKKIKCIKLINRLQKHAHGEARMTPTQVDAAKFLINKRIPTLNNDERSELGAAINIQINFVNPTATP